MIRHFIQRPVFTSVLYIIALLIGGISATMLDIEDEPNIQTNKYTISVSYSSTIQSIRNSIVAPLEQKFLNISGVELVTSDINHGGAKIIIYFAQKSDVYENMLRLQDAIASSRTDIPNEAIVSISGDSNPFDSIMTLYFVSDKKTIPEINFFVHSQLKHVLEATNGVSAVTINSEMHNSCIVEIIPQNMYACQIPYRSMKQAFLDNIGISGGSCNIPVGNSVVSVNVGYEDQDILKHPIINKHGHMVQLKEIANIKKGIRSKSNITRINGREAVSVDIQKKPDCNMISVCNDIRKILPKIENICSSNGITAGVTLDKSLFVIAGIHGVYKTILESIVLVCIVVFLFLRSLRLSFIPIAAIPLSIIPMFAFLKYFGTTINVYSLFGIVLAIGLVVDDAIVVVENIYKYVEKGMSAYEASVEGTRSIAVSIIAMTITLAIVYAPILLVSDPNIKNFVDFAATITISVLISGIVSLTITPMMFNLVYNNKQKLEHSDKGLLAFLERIYMSALVFLIRRRYSLFAFLYSFIIVLLIFSSKFIRVEETIEVDKGIVYLEISNKRDNEMDIKYMDNQLLRLSEKINKDDIMQDIDELYIGLSWAQKQHYLRVRLVPHKKRKFTTEHISKRIVEIHNKEASDFRMFSSGSSGEFKMYFAYLQVYDPSYAALKARCENLSSDPNIVGLHCGILSTDIRYTNAYKLLLDREKCCKNNIGPNDILETLMSIHENRFFRKTVSDSVHKVHMSVYSPDTPDRLDELLNIPVSIYSSDSTGKKQETIVPIKNFVRTITEKELNREYRVNGINGMFVRFKLAPGVSKSGFRDALEIFNAKMAGICSVITNVEEERKIKAMRNTYFIFILSVFLIYLIIAALLESFFLPLAIILTVPASALGGILMLLFYKQKLNTVSIVGMITLVGLITKHGIMLLDYVVSNCKKLSPEAIILEACLSRFRPIIMTTICMIIGAIPLINKKTEFNEYKVPIGLVIIGGMALGTLLTLFIVPCFYVIVEEMFGRSRFMTNASVQVYKPRKEPDDEDFDDPENKPSNK